MKVTQVETTVLRVPFDRDYWGRDAWKNDYEVARRPGRRLDVVYPIRWRMRHRWADDISTVLVQVHTDEGVTGIGESKGAVAPEAVKHYIDDHLVSWLIGQDPRDVRVLWDRYRASMRGRGHIEGLHQEAAAGLDIACWDIVGKSAGRSLSEMLGGRYRIDVPVYYSGVAGLRDNADDEQRAALAAGVRRAMSVGHTAVKLAIGFGEAADAESVQLAREVGGDDLLILVDALGSYDYAQALSLCRTFADLGVGWFETPLATDDFRGYVELGRASPIAIANDLVWTVALLKDMLSAGARMVCIPETIKVGVTETMRIAELADTFGCGFAPHCSIGSTIQFAANLHVAAASPNTLIMELWENENPLTRSLCQPSLQVADGHISLPNGDGLGIELELDTVSELAGAGATHS